MGRGKRVEGGKRRVVVERGRGGEGEVGGTDLLIQRQSINKCSLFFF